MIEKLNGILEDGRVSPVALKGDEDECIVALSLLTPGTGGSMIVLGVVGISRGNFGFVEKGKGIFLKVGRVQRRLNATGSFYRCIFTGVDDEVCDLGVGLRLSGGADGKANPCCAPCHLRNVKFASYKESAKISSVRNRCVVSVKCFRSIVVEVGKNDLLS